MITKTLFKIPKMDCPSEEKLIKMALGNVNDIEKLKFDLKNRELTVWHSETNSQTILAKLVPLNFDAEIKLTEKYESNLDADDFLANPENTKKEAVVLKYLLAINATMFFVEIVTGLMAQSTGLIADSLDMFADSAVYGLSLYAVGKTKKLQSKSAMLSGILQLILAAGSLFEIIRRFINGSEPNSPMMMGISLVALIANVSCLILLAKHRDGAVHMKASWIFSTNDVIANVGVIIAGGLVYLSKSRFPDLVIGFIITLIVLRGAFTIIKLARTA